METIEKIDVEGGALTVSEALATVEIELERAKFAGKNLIKIVHGYGSKGVGGEIKKALFLHLKTMKKQGKIFDFFPCEKFGFTLKNYEIYVKKFPLLLTDANIKTLNPGATIVFL